MTASMAVGFGMCAGFGLYLVPGAVRKMLAKIQPEPLAPFSEYQEIDR